MMLQLFDTFVKSFLDYNREVWGFLTAGRCERVHRKYLKWIIDVKISTNNAALFVETGRSPLFIDRYERIIKYWLKKVKPDYDNCMVKAVFCSLVNEIMTKENAVNWISNIRNLLQRTGFYEVWLYLDSVDVKIFIPLLKVRIRVQYIAEWDENL